MDRTFHQDSVFESHRFQCPTYHSVTMNELLKQFTVQLNSRPKFVAPFRKFFGDMYLNPS
jgi:hypothetical protein